MRPARFTVERLSNRGVVFLVDDCEAGLRSVTNDAEAVVREIVVRYGAGFRIIYRDTEGQWAELLHQGPEFTGFAPADPPDWAGDLPPPGEKKAPRYKAR